MAVGQQNIEVSPYYKQQEQSENYTWSESEIEKLEYSFTRFNFDLKNFEKMVVGDVELKKEEGMVKTAEKE